MKTDDFDALVVFFETLRPETLDDFGQHYAADAYFKDPFNEVRGLPAIKKIFAHMFRQLVQPRFVIHERVVYVSDANSALLVWTLFYRSGGSEQTIRGVSHLKFDTAGKITWHRDYWDAAEELYAKLPLLGWLMRLLQRKLRAS